LAKAELKQVQEEPANTNKSSSQELVRQQASQELVFGIVGHVGSGTSTIAEQLVTILEDQDVNGIKQEAKILKARTVIESWAKANDEALPDESEPPMAKVKRYQDLGDSMRSHGDHAAVARGLVRQVRMTRATMQNGTMDDEQPVLPDGKPRAYILDSIRHPAEISLLRRIYGEAFVLVGVVCEQSVRADRISQKYRDAGLDEAERFMQRDAKASQKHGQRVSDAFHLSDYFIDNTASRFVKDDKTKSNEDWEIPDHIARLIRLVTHAQIERPTIEETAMYAAGGAAMRSACLSRQVGASVLDKKGYIVATGANEVPKAGGGVYGELDSSNDATDDRCFVNRRNCANTKEQSAIATSLAEELIADMGEKVELNVLVEKIRSSRIGELLEFSRAVHAEMDALLEAGRKGVSTIGSRVFVTTFPCHYCARHIVSAGVDEVQYIEPYPKSKAFVLHGDSIQNDVSDPSWEPPSDGGTKVLFRPFTGVAPRMYRRAFQKDRQLKDSYTGDLSISAPEWGSPYDISKSSYAEFELSLTRGLTW
jgi:deoxycytidylate deaminase